MIICGRRGSPDGAGSGVRQDDRHADPGGAGQVRRNAGRGRGGRGGPLGWVRSAPYDELDLVPLSDGGPGFLDVLHVGLGGECRRRDGPRPAGRPGAGAAAAGRGHGVRRGGRGRRPAPGRAGRSATRCAASSYGVGELLAAAADAGARRIVVGVGGTATIDGGAGMLAALGVGPAELLPAAEGRLAELTEDVDLSPGPGPAGRHRGWSSPPTSTRR